MPLRGKQVMLDGDVAILYNYETKNINKAMKRNIERFPEDFCFQLTKEEIKDMWFQFGTTYVKNNMKYRSEKYLPYAYTEQGISINKVKFVKKYFLMGKFMMHIV